MSLSDCKNLKNSQMNNRVIILSGIVIGSFIGLGSITRGTDLFGLFFISICCFIFMTILFKVNDPVLKKVLIIAFALRIGLALVNTFILPLPDTGNDAVVYELTGLEYAIAWNTGFEANFTFGYIAPNIYSKIIGAIYFISGRVPLLVQFVNVVLGVFIVYYVYKIILYILCLKTIDRLPQ